MTVVIPNYNSTVRIGYIVQHKDDSIPEDPGQLYTLLIESIPLQGEAKFTKGKAAGRLCTFSPAVITIPKDLPVGETIMTSLPSSASAQGVIISSTASTNMSMYLTNTTVVGSYGAQQPKSDSTIFPNLSISQNQVPGIGFQVVLDAGNGKEPVPLKAGPWIFPEINFTDEGSAISLKIVKTGPIPVGHYDVRLNARWYFGSNNLNYTEIYTPGWIGITVV
jgi:hypothetical protein